MATPRGGRRGREQRLLSLVRFALVLLVACGAPPATPPPSTPPPPVVVAVPEPKAPVAEPPAPTPVATEPVEEEVASVRFGMELDEGSYAFPDGLKLTIKVGDGCDFDPSEPCPIGLTYRVHATQGAKSEDSVLKTKSMTLLGGHSIDVIQRRDSASTKFRVQKQTQKETQKETR